MIRQFSAAESNNSIMTKNTIINIGRQFGSGGKEIAKVLGQKLGIEIYDNELISKAAEESGFSKELFLNSDESRSLFSVSSFFSSAGYGLIENYVGDNELFRIQSEVIRGIAEKGSAIFIGRCADYILRDKDCLDIFITAPDEIRAKRISERLSVSIEVAKNLIKKKDRTRETYYNFFTLGNWGVASSYDMCIDSSVLGIEKTAELIISVAKGKGIC